MQAAIANRIQTVSELTRSIRGLLETSFPFVTVVGEISNLRQPLSGHLYFTLKDKQAQIRAVLFKTQQRYLDTMPADGLQVICRGRISVYEPRGEYQLIVDHLDPMGAGALQLAFERLRNRLAAEGLFDQARKQPLPFLPEVIALVTSPRGAAIRDFLRQAKARMPGTAIEVMPVKVQGEAAAGEIAEAIALCNQRDQAQVIVLCRGGGSLEDLWAFNEEQVARAICQSKIPVVSAVGHEQDVTIADLAADLRAPTPTAAAEAVLPDRQHLARQVAGLLRRLSMAASKLLSHSGLRLENLRQRLGSPSLLLAHFLLRLDHARANLEQAMRHRLQTETQRNDQLRALLLQHNPALQLREQRQRLQRLSRHLSLAATHLLQRRQQELAGRLQVLEAVSPLAVLARGYAIVTDRNGLVVRRADQVHPGDRLRIRLDQGELECEVKQLADQPPPSAKNR